MVSTMTPGQRVRAALKGEAVDRVPLCFWHHRGRRDSYHGLGEKRFAEWHRIDLPDLVRELIARYHERP